MTLQYPEVPEATIFDTASAALSDKSTIQYLSGQILSFILAHTLYGSIAIAIFPQFLSSLTCFWAAFIESYTIIHIVFMYNPNIHPFGKLGKRMFEEEAEEFLDTVRQVKSWFSQN